MVSYTTDSELERFTLDVFGSVGMPRQVAASVASVLVWADLRDVGSHGVSRLPQYIQWVQDGLMNVCPHMQAEALSGALLRLQADRAPGPLAMVDAVKRLVPMAKAEGIAAGVVSGMTHSGALGYYTCKAAGQGLACIAVNAGIPFIPYHGSRAAALGTNPISIAVPGGGNDPIVFDMASSVVALGKLMQAKKAGKPLEPGWAIDSDGAPTTDATRASMVLPLGGAKGSGLSLMIECLASLLGGSPLISDALSGTGEGRKHRQNAMLVAIDVTKFMPLDDFKAQVGRLTDVLKALPLALGTEEIFVPGERGHNSMKQRQLNGIPLPDGVVADLGALAKRQAVQPIEMQDR